MSESRRILTPYVSRHWSALAGVVGSTAVLTAAELAGPWPLKLVIDRIADRRAPFDLRPADLWFLALVAGLVLAIAVAGALAAYAAELWLNRAAERIVHDVRTAVYAHLQRLSLAFHHRRPTGDLVSSVTGDVAAVRTLVADSAGEIASSVLILAGMLAVTLVLDPVLALATFAATPVLALVTWRYTRRTKALARQQRAQEGEIASLATEALSAMQVVKAFGSERWERARVERRSESRRQIGVEAVRTEARFAGIVDVIGAGAASVALVVGVFRVSAGALSPGDLIVFVSYAVKTYKPLRTIAKQLPKAQRGFARAERIAELLASEAVLTERSGAYRGPRTAGAIAFDRVSFAYEQGRPALRDVSLEIAAGQRVVVVGRSGAGKSTFGALVARLYDPDEGAVSIDGRDARDCSLEWLRGQVGVLLQDTVLFSGTVAENIAYATDASREEIESAARIAGAHEFVSALPEGYDTRLGPRGVGLSGGQRQRIGIARVLLRDPPVLVLDEPTTGLDAASEREVMDGLERLMAGRTTILVTHSDRLARRAERALVIGDGRVIADGAPADVLRTRRPRHAAAGRDLAAMPPLLDPDRMAAPLRRSLGRAVGSVSIADARLKPGRELIVRYDAVDDGRPCTAVAVAPASRELARTAPAGARLTYDEELSALVQWFPYDLALPALALPRQELLVRLAEAGVAVAGDAAGPELLGYKPLGRAVVALDGHVLKLYCDERRFRAAEAGLAAVATSGL
ncbi:MAG TPA: ABC transporter ATP-binding protein, partial [Gaiellaceae bacterium]|nr:ABC transporter ATP-binding protein [Gaiellaceae bacterium]